MYRLPLATLLVIALFGCTDAAQVELHEPGEYKGDTDPLLQASTSEDLNEQLRQRFMTVQTDR